MMNDRILNVRGKSDLVKLFWLGFIIYTLCFFLSISIKSAPHMFLSALQGLALLLLIATTFSLIERIDGIFYFKFLFTIYFVWLLSILIRGGRVEFDFIQRIFLNPFEGGLYVFVPLMALVSRSAIFLKKMFSTISIFGGIFLIFCILSFRLLTNSDLSNLDAQGAIEYSAKILSIPSAFIVLTQKYHSKRTNRIAMLTLILTLLFSIIRARRGLILITTIPILLSLGPYLFGSHGRQGNLIGKFIFILSLIFLAVVYVVSLQDDNYGIFSSLVSRSTDDTRSGVEYYFFLDMTIRDWVIGKGIDGSYFYPYAENLYRNGIESDYLNIILKGGIISLVLMLLILIPAIIKGIFFSKNTLSQAAGIWILMYVLSLYPTPMTKFSLFYLLVWISVGICYSSSFRALTDDIIIEHFRKV
jgi:hypothetical protein